MSCVASSRTTLHSGELHIQTGVFDNMSLPTLPGFARLAIQPSKKARSKPKAKGKTQNQQHESTTDKGEPDESGDAAKVRQCIHQLKIAETERKWVARLGL